MKNSRLKIIYTFLFIMIYIVPTFIANAADWTPLVKIPGLPQSGPITLNQYLVGLYSFLLSIVGIIAVGMMILGGVRYITAAGSETAVSDAKSMIQGALFGLILAIGAWIVINTINPDVLFIKNPNL